MLGFAPKFFSKVEGTCNWASLHEKRDEKSELKASGKDSFMGS